MKSKTHTDQTHTHRAVDWCLFLCVHSTCLTEQRADGDGQKPDDVKHSPLHQVQ